MNFFGIGYQEIALILVAALIVFGPNRLPEVAGQAARFLRDARKMVTELTGEFERNAGVREFKTAIEGELAGVRKELEGAGISVKNDLQKAANDANATFKSATAKPGVKKPVSTSTAPAAPAKTATAANVKPKASKADPFAGLVALPPVAPKSVRMSANGASDSSRDQVDGPAEPIRETSEAVMRARERRASAGYNRRIAAS